MWFIVLLTLGAIGAVTLLAGVGYGVREGFYSGSIGRRCLLAGLALLLLGFGLPLLVLLSRFG